MMALYKMCRSGHCQQGLAGSSLIVRIPITVSFDVHHEPVPLRLVLRHLASSDDYVNDRRLTDMLPVLIAFGLIMGLLLMGARTPKERTMALTMCAVSILVWGAITGFGDDGGMGEFAKGTLLAAANLGVGLVAGRLFGARLNRSPRAVGRR
jgi:hypothetical protein